MSVNFDGDKFCDVKKLFEFRQLRSDGVSVACDIRCSS